MSVFKKPRSSRLGSVGILEKEREPGVGKLGLHGNFDTGFERNTSGRIVLIAREQEFVKLVYFPISSQPRPVETFFHL